METLNWSELGFGYIKTDYNVRCYYRDGKWGELEVSSSEILNTYGCYLSALWTGSL